MTTLCDIAQAFRGDKFLCPSVSRDELGAGGEALCSMIDSLAQVPVPVDVKILTYVGVYESMCDSLEENFKNPVLQAHLPLIYAGLKVFRDVAADCPERPLHI